MQWDRSQKRRALVGAARLSTCAVLLGVGFSVGCDQGSSFPDTANGGAGGSVGGAGGSAGTGGSGGSAAGGAGGGAGTGGSAGSGGATGGAAGNAGAGGSAGAGGAPPYVPPQCLNAEKDGDETGVDCGGSCEVECPDYQVNPPDAGNEGQSSCDGGNAFMCPRSMVFSPEMKQAAADDSGMDDPPFTYAVVGFDGPSDGNSTCCECWQLVYDTPSGASGVARPKPVIAQVFNTGVGKKNSFDLYMASGGHGNFNGCTANGTLYSGYPDQGGDWQGGTRASRFPECQAGYGLESCTAKIEAECNQIEADSDLVESTSRISCIQTNQANSLYHNNWNVLAKKVACPENLTRVTGCRLNDSGSPAPDPTAQDPDSADSSFASGFGPPPCRTAAAPPAPGRNNTSNTQGEWDVFYSCGRDGNPWTK